MNELVRNVLMGAAGAADASTFVDDVFSTYLYEETGSTVTVNNSVDMSKGGMVWFKNREAADDHALIDTVRGGTKVLHSNNNNAQSTQSGAITSFNNNGFTIGNYGTINGGSNKDVASWTFRKAPGFFDVVQYSGDNSDAKTFSHSLGSIPGLIIIKTINDSAANWTIYHRDVGFTNGFIFQDYQAQFASPIEAVSNTTFTVTSAENVTGENYIVYLFAGGESTAATARSVDFDGNDRLVIPATSDLSLNTNDFTFECWVYPTTYGEIVGAFNGNPNYKGWLISLDFSGPTGKMALWLSDGGSSYNQFHSNSVVPLGQWSHVAFTKSGTNYTFYLNGVQDGSFTSSITPLDSEQDIYIAADTNPTSQRYLTGKISNLRITKQVLYTTSFKPSTEPLTTTSQGATASNVKLLCCNNSSVTGSTVAPSSANTYSINVTASSSSAYTLSGNDRNGSVSGNNVTVTANVGDTLNFAVNASGHPFYIRVSNGGYNVSTPAATNQGSQSGTVSWTPNTAGSFVYQCGNHSGMIGTITINAASGSITANGDPTASTHVPFDDPEGFQFGEGGNQNIIKCGNYTGNGSSLDVELGFEPSWVMIKSSTETYNWIMSDVMRGLPAIGDGRGLFANTNNAEFNYGSVARPRATGFNVTETQANNNGSKFIYIAIRRPDGLVGKPAEAGTDVFATDTGSGSSAGPEYDSGFPVDFAIHRTIASTNDWWTSAKLIRGKHLETNNTGAQSTSDAADYVFDYNDGWYKNGYGSGVQSWMWKRHAGFDVVAYKGNSVFASNGGHAIAHNLSKTPEMIWVKDRDQSSNWHVFHKDLTGNNILILNLSAGTSGTGGDSDDFVSVSSTHFTIGYENAMNNSSRNYLAMLFASVDGISKVGSYSGTGSAGHVITTGFTPRFLIIKTTNASNNWFVYDSVRGLGAGADPYLQLDTSNAQGGTSDDVFATSSTGFTINQNYPSVNASGQNYIYYAHA